MHSPPGVLFTFPSRYFSLSVVSMYLALDGGPPCFPLGSSCPVVLWIPARLSLFRVRGSHSLCRTFPDASTRMSGLLQVRNPKRPKSSGLGSSRFARRYSGNLFDFFSSDYLDVSVHRVFSPYLEDKVTRRYSCRVAPFGNPWINAYLQLTTAYRSLSRPSSFRNA